MLRGQWVVRVAHQRLESDCGGGLSDVLFGSTDDQGSAIHGERLFIALYVVDRKGPPRWKLDESLSWDSHSAEYIYVGYRDNTLKPMYIWLGCGYPLNLT